MVCGCCSSRPDTEKEHGDSNEKASPMSMRMDRADDGGIKDDDSDKEAVQWLRNRSFEKRRPSDTYASENMAQSPDNDVSSDDVEVSGSSISRQSPPRTPTKNKNVDSDEQAVEWLRGRSHGRKLTPPNHPQQEESSGVEVVATPTAGANKNMSSTPIDLDNFEDFMDESSTDESDNRPEGFMRLESEIEMRYNNDGPTAEAQESHKEKTVKQASKNAVSRGKYTEACRLLHETLIQKQNVLSESEHGFLDSLVTSIQTADDNLDLLSDVESAVNVLTTDPLFQAEEQEDVIAALKRGKKAKTETTLEALSTASSNLFSDDEDPFSIPLSTKSRSSQGEDNWWEVGKDDTTTQQETPQLVEESVESPSKPLESETNGKKVDLVRFDGWATFQSESSGPFRILGTSYSDESAKPHVLSPLLMEALRGFLPFSISEENFWLKYSLVRDGASLKTMLNSIRASAWTIIGIETTSGDVFGSFTGSPWRIRKGWFGSGESFLWRLKKSRFATPQAIQKNPNEFDREMEVYPYTGDDNYVQFCTRTTLAVGGGDWAARGQASPHKGEPSGIGLMIDGDLAGGETNSSSTFANPRLCRQTSNKSEFDISNMEVWTLTPCTTVADARTLELRKLFVEEQRRT